MKTWLLTPLAAVALLAGPAAAQRPLIPGELARGALGTSDPRLPDNTYYDEWSFTGRRGETVVVTMESRAFDAYLYIGTMRGGVFRELRRDDDGGGGNNARIELRLPEGGTYVVRASSLATQTGPYTLSLAAGRTQGGGWDDDRPEPGRPPRDGYLEPGRTIRGRLSDSDPKLDNGAAFHTYRYEGRRGERLTLTLRSVDFDAYLVVGTPGGRHGIQTALARDDDGGGGHDARLVHTFQGDGEYVVRVNSLMPGTGRYTLEVESSMYDGPAGPDDEWEEDGDPGYEEDGGGFDQRLVGRWGLVPPTARVDAGSWSSISANARMGILTIDEEGAYTWRTNGRTLRGQLVPITPRGGALADTEYYAVNDGRGEFYVFLAPYRGGERMQVSSRATDRLVAHGYSDDALR